MRIASVFFIMTWCVGVLFGVPAEAADVAKIGVIDFQRVLEASSAGKYAQAEINKKGKQMEADLKKRGAEIEEIKKRIERESLVMSKEMREQKQREIRININDFKTLQQRYMKEFKAFETRLVQRIRKDVVELVQGIGKSGGYLMIVEKRTGEVIYSPKTVDATDKLVQKYNVTFAKKPAKKKKK
jgi:outer membrane protein